MGSNFLKIDLVVTKYILASSFVIIALIDAFYKQINCFNKKIN